ncbi:hypothetical protein KAJ27_18360, partial [bacterium]|nr:hypothetical protein [bacterium]
VDNTQLRDQNSETTKTDIGNETTNEAQTAFTVEITPEAQNILAAQQPIETQPRATESQQTTQDMAQASRSGNIINLTA